MIIIKYLNIVDAPYSKGVVIVSLVISIRLTPPEGEVDEVTLRAYISAIVVCTGFRRSLVAIILDYLLLPMTVQVHDLRERVIMEIAPPDHDPLALRVFRERNRVLLGLFALRL